MGNSGTSAPDPKQFVSKLITSLLNIAVLLFVLWAVYVASWGVMLKFDQSQLPPTNWWWPKYLNQYVHTYYPDYTLYSNINALALGGSYMNVFSNITTAQDCQMACNRLQPRCIGIQYKPSTKACVTLSSFGTAIRMDGTDLYTVAGNQPSSVYTEYSGNNINIVQTYKTVGTTDKLACATECSNATTSNCTGFTIKTDCRLYSNASTANLIIGPGFTSFIYTDTSSSLL